jgi:hypothetical protein
MPFTYSDERRKCRYTPSTPAAASTAYVFGRSPDEVFSSNRHVKSVADEVLRNAVVDVHINTVSSIGSNEGYKRHLILGESSSLVRKDDGDATESLTLLGHARDGPGVGHSHNYL